MRRRSWDLDRVYLRDADGQLSCLPAEWTDAVPADPFVVLAAGRAPFRTGELLGAAVLVQRLRAGLDDGRPGVQEIMP